MRAGLWRKCGSAKMVNFWGKWATSGPHELGKKLWITPNILMFGLAGTLHIMAISTYRPHLLHRGRESCE